ncbi:hypothetical protein HPB47_003492 [Ixodes persulcatus]|uniref:Uncharacterized protein n=1 Tax=Ixodes persulcatus TaxID=34615 RepID=A0AC60PJB4_IXOPE|nr:hypothetical protein HPB47_003492 [Ixodes persulcatus]
MATSVGDTLEDDVVAIPWTSFCDKAFNCLVKHKHDAADSSLRIYASDFIRVYEEILGQDLLLERCKELNPDLEVTAAYLSEHLSQGITKALKQNCTAATQEACMKIVTCNAGLLVMQLHTMISGVPFLWEFRMPAQTASDAFYRHVTLPMIVMIVGLQKQQEDLFALLNDKDSEISDYKRSGQHLSRKHLETKVFDAGRFRRETLTPKHLKDCLSNVHLNPFGSEAGLMYRKLMEAYKDITTSACEPETISPENHGSSNIPVEVVKEMRETTTAMDVTRLEEEPKPHKVKKVKKRMRL